MATKYKLEYAPSFHLDVVQIAIILDEYPEKAARIFTKLDISLANLETMPELYPVYEASPVFRKIVVEDYIAFYLVDKNAKTVEIHRLLYGSMDLPKHL
jgi:plasmid stabilization system protein ParE